MASRLFRSRTDVPWRDDGFSTCLENDDGTATVETNDRFGGGGGGQGGRVMVARNIHPRDHPCNNPNANRGGGFVASKDEDFSTCLDDGRTHISVNAATGRSIKADEGSTARSVGGTSSVPSYFQGSGGSGGGTASASQQGSANTASRDEGQWSVRSNDGGGGGAASRFAQAQDAQAAGRDHHATDNDEGRRRTIKRDNKSKIATTKTSTTRIVAAAAPEVSPVVEPRFLEQETNEEKRNVLLFEAGREKQQLQQHQRDYNDAYNQKVMDSMVGGTTTTGVMPFAPPVAPPVQGVEAGAGVRSNRRGGAPAPRDDNVGAFYVSEQERSILPGQHPGQREDSFIPDERYVPEGDMEASAISARVAGGNGDQDERIRNYLQSMAANAPVVDGRADTHGGNNDEGNNKGPSRWWGRNNNSRALWIAVALLVVGIVATVVGVVVSRKGAAQPPSDQSTQQADLADEGGGGQTKRPEQPFATSSRSERIRTISESISGPGALTFTTSYTPQIMARDWLLYYDTYSPTPPQTDAELGQRYVLAVLYFALGGEDWVESRGWMGDTGECEGWYGVTCSYGGSDPDSGVQLASELHLGKNGLSGKLPEEVAYLPLLEVLDLTASYDQDEGYSTGDVTGTIPASIGQLKALKVLNLGFNQISGTLPPSLMELTSLTKLELGGNPLEGTIPTDIDRLANLEQLGIGWLVDSSGGLTGTIPSSIGNLSSLNWLQISYNRLTGIIPSEIGKLTNLENLFLYWNEISGTIPPSIGKLTNVEKMALCCNELSGTIPTNFGDLTKIEVLKFHDNNLVGTMPEEICALKEDYLLSNLASDCEEPNPEVVCSCCDQCFETI